MEQKKKHYFTKFELWLWALSYVFILAAFVIFRGNDYVTLSATLLGVVSLTFNAKGNPIGPFLMIIFSVLYSVVSFSFAYYGEMLTYLGMSAPMALWALVSWLRNPFKGKKSQVTVGDVSKTESVLMVVLAVLVSLLFYYILKALNTANLIPSTLSVTTSFMAAYLSARRSPYFALAYAANDVVLIVLWIFAAVSDTSYLSVVVCFLVFLIYDMYSFYSWLTMRKKQRAALQEHTA